MNPDQVFRDEVEGGGQCVRMVFTATTRQALRARRLDRRGRRRRSAREHRRARQPRRRRAAGGLRHAPRRRRHRGPEPDPRRRPTRPTTRSPTSSTRRSARLQRRRQLPLSGDQLQRAGRGHRAAARRARPCAATFANVTPDAERFIVGQDRASRRRARTPFDDPNSGQVAGANGVPAPPSSVPELLEARKVANTRGTFDLRYNVPVEVDDIDRCEAFLEDGTVSRPSPPGASEREHDPRGVRHRRHGSWAASGARRTRSCASRTTPRSTASNACAREQAATAQRSAFSSVPAIGNAVLAHRASPTRRTSRAAS